jgi:hypothetical protein
MIGSIAASFDGCHAIVTSPSEHRREIVLATHASIIKSSGIIIRRDDIAIEKISGGGYDFGYASILPRRVRWMISETQPGGTSR